MIKNIKKKLIHIYIFIYGIVNLLFLTTFPMMHSDESWLSGLTSSMMENGLSSTESFFNLFPRFPHAIKIVYHLIQMVFLKAFGNSLFSFRLISILFGLASIYLCYLIAKKLLFSELFSLLFAIIVSLDIQFIYSSHFARQEIIILTGLLLCFYLLITKKESFTIKHNILIGSLIGLLIGIHPNSFIVALVIGSCYMYYIFVEMKLKLSDLLWLIITVTGFAILFIGISYLLDGNFINNYLAYGSELGVTSSIATKSSGLFTFYQKLFFQISGTYFTPFIIIQLLLFFVSFIIGCISTIKYKSFWLFIIPLIAINIGYIVIGRYSQPSILFIFPFGYLLLFKIVSEYIKSRKAIVILIIIIAIFINSLITIIPNTNNDYKNYINILQREIGQEEKILINLNGLYAFSSENIFDYRNLHYLDDYNLSFKEYIIENDITYIVYPEEIDFIYDNRPTWNIIYGNVYPYYEDMTTFLNDQCELVSTFTSPYAMRILRYSEQQNWFVKIYKVKR